MYLSLAFQKGPCVFALLCFAHIICYPIPSHPSLKISTTSLTSSEKRPRPRPHPHPIPVPVPVPDQDVVILPRFHVSTIVKAGLFTTRKSRGCIVSSVAAEVTGQVEERKSSIPIPTCILSLQRSSQLLFLVVCQRFIVRYIT